MTAVEIDEVYALYALERDEDKDPDPTPPAADDLPELSDEMDNMSDRNQM